MGAENNEVLQKVANMVAYSVPNGQIAMVCGISEDELNKLLDTPQFQTELASVEFDGVEKQKTLNDGWDAIENSALAHLVTAMQTMKDVDFSLKVAAVANKAVRRGGRFNKPIDGNLGSRAVVTLNQTFVNRLQQNVQIGSDAAKGKSQKKKDHDFLPPSGVEKLLQLNNHQEEVERIVDAIPAFAY